MVRRIAFTLVELLVVIAIISLLIAIIAPSLGAAKQLAQSSYCRSTLNSLNKSSLVYTEMNRGNMMVYLHAPRTDSAGASYVRGAPAPNDTPSCFAGVLSMKTGLLDIPMNFGLVYVAKILDKPEMFYCPAPRSEAKYLLSSYKRPWGSAPGPNTQLVKCGYMWNPWVTVLDNSPAEGSACTYDDGLRIDRHRSDRFVTSDLLWGQEVTGHLEGRKAHWNVGYADGHVIPIESVGLWTIYTAGDGKTSTAARWLDYGATTPPAQWLGITRPWLEQF